MLLKTSHPLISTTDNGCSLKMFNLIQMNIINDATDFLWE